MTNFTIQPVALRRVFPQSVTSIDIKRDQDTITIHTQAGTTEVDLHSAILSSSTSFLIFKKLTLQTPNATFLLDGITSDSVEILQKAIDEAKSRNSLIAPLLAQRDSISSVIAAWDGLAKRDDYITASDLDQFTSHIQKYRLLTNVDSRLIDKLPQDHAGALRKLLPVLADPRKAATVRNAAYITHELKTYKTFFDTVESNPLTEQQREAIVHDEDNALVLAGAGTGKTSCIVGKVGYLLKKGVAKPEEILLLAFTKKAAQEMQERIREKLGVELPIRTFHALGLEIVAAARNKKPSLCAEAEDPVVMSRTLQRLVGESLSDDGFRKDFFAFQAKLRQPFKARWEFKTESEYTNYLLDVEPRALTGRLLKSYEECEIANWLFINCIRFEYEWPYAFDTATFDHRQYKPDFYLPDYDIYIEHWGIDRNNRTAPFVDREAYIDKMKWARREHGKNGTKLVETYSWEEQEGVLLTNLETKLREQGVELESMTAAVALATLNEAGRIDPFVNLVSTFLRLFKSANGAAPDKAIADLLRKADQTVNGERGQIFVRLFAKLFSEYEDLIHSRGEIDFEDMIALARAHVEDGTYQSPFRYILVDEFQDIATGRAKLIQALKKQVRGAKLFCVGDDWQSIYRFAGSNISLTTAFDTYFGYTRKTTLGRTFRFHNKIADFSSRFVQQNGGQLRKHLTTQTVSTEPGVVVSTQNASTDPLFSILTEIAEIAHASQKRATVFLLGRYKHNAPANLAELRQVFPNLDIRAMTAHASKGLEADYVVVHSLKSGKFGFPSQIADDPVLTMVLPDSEKFLFAEERRLFYVALTRAKKRVYLIADAATPSEFVREIIADSGYEKIVDESALARATSSACPQCKRGQITQRDGDFGRFHSCSNYPICDYKAPTCTRCKRGRMCQADKAESVCGSCGFKSRVCPRCQSGIIVERRTKTSGRVFWGCSNYRRAARSCTYREAVSDSHLTVQR